MRDIRKGSCNMINFLINIKNTIIKLVSYTFIAFTLLLTLYTIFDGKNAWPLVTLEIFIILILSFEKIGKMFKTLKIGKEGIELETLTKEAQKTTKEAKETLDELKKLALIFSKNLARLITRTGRLGGSFSTLELYQYRKETENLLSNFDISSNEIRQNIEDIDNFILLDLIFRISEQYNATSLVEHYTAINSFRSNDILKTFDSDIDGIEKYLIENDLMNEENKKRLDDLKYFHKHRELTEHALNYVRTKK